MATAQVKLPPKLIPVFSGQADVRGAYGGRGSGKTRNFAKMAAIRAHMWAQEGREGIVLCGRQFMNSLADSSLEEIKAAVASEEWLTPHFDIGEKYVRTFDRRVSFSFTGLDRNIDSIKSKARILLAWVDEAEAVTEEGWIKLIPTLREIDSELWVTWNPEKRGSPTDRRFRESKNPRQKVVQLNWRDNPWFTPGCRLDRTRVQDMEERPEQYDHIWEGDYITYVDGAYYAASLRKAMDDGRIGFIAEDPLMSKRAFFDIGGTGRKSDATSIWIAQFIGQEIRVLDFYEAEQQPLATHVAWMRSRGYTPESTSVWLPHDGAQGDKVFAVSYESALRDVGYDVTIVPNQGRGAAMERIDAGRRLFPRMRFNAETTEPGRLSLAYYRENYDDDREIGLGPLHDKYSHAADAFGLMCIVYEEAPTRPVELPQVDNATLGIA